VGEKRNTHRILMGKLQEGESFEGLGVDGRIMLKWILNT
jgi:hypothetical protein